METKQPGHDDDSEAAWDAELERRAAEIKSGQAIGEPASKVFAELRDKYGQARSPERSSDP
jgi:hypothetical protein